MYAYFGCVYVTTELREPAMGSYPDKHIGNNDNSNIFLKMLNDMCGTMKPMILCRAMSIGTKCKHVCNFPAVTLHVLC